MRKPLHHTRYGQDRAPRNVTGRPSLEKRKLRGGCPPQSSRRCGKDDARSFAPGTPRKRMPRFPSEEFERCPSRFR